MPPFAYNPWAPSCQCPEKTLKHVSIQPGMQTLAWKSFMHCFWNTAFWCYGVQDVQPRRRRSFFKEGWGSSSCQCLGKWPVSLMQALSPRRRSWGGGKGWGERRGGRRNCSTEVFLMTSREGSSRRGMMCGTRGQEAFLPSPPSPPPPGRRCAEWILPRLLRAAQPCPRPPPAFS